MASKLSAQRAAVTRSLSTSVEQNGKEIAAALEPVLFPDGVPESLTVEAVVLALGAAPMRLYGVLADTDTALSKELSDDESYRDGRDDSVAQLRVDWQRTQGAMIAGWGPDVLRQVDLAGEMPRDPDQLVQRGRGAADLVETAPLGDPEIPTDRAAVAAHLRGSTDRVASFLDHVSRERREEQAARQKRDEADDDLRRVYVGFADAFAGFATAVARPGVAQRVRPTARRRAGLPEEEDILATDPALNDPAATDPAADPSTDPNG